MLTFRNALRRRTGFDRPSRRRMLLETLENRSLLAALPAADFAPGEILIGFDGDMAQQFHVAGPGAAFQTAANRYGQTGIQAGAALMFHAGPRGDDVITLWKLAPGKDVAAVAGQLSKLPGVAYAEPNYLWSIAATPQFPNDLNSNLWGLHNTGQNGGLADADIDAPEAWGIHKGTGNVVVGVIDTGVNYNHADLAANIWTNTVESAGLAGIDDDGNGYIDDIRGYDFVSNDTDPMDDNGHGTHVSGTIGGVGNNGTGVVGVNWNVKIMPLKFLDSTGSGSTANAIRAVNYATQMRSLYLSSGGTKGANIVLTNNSWGGGSASQALQDAITASGDKNMLFVAAAGNDGRSTASYPARYPNANIISVAATDRLDKLAAYKNGPFSWGSNYGPDVDVGAPGVSVYSTYNTGYSTLDGTSMAAPHVAGTAALVWDYLQSQGETPSYQTVRDTILQGGDPLPSLAGKVTTGSRLNASGALVLARGSLGSTPRITISDASATEGGSGPASQAAFNVRLTIPSSVQVTVNYDTADGTATANSDYTSATDTITFAPGETTKTIVVQTLDDALLEGNETFFVNLSGAVGGTIGDGSGAGTIIERQVSISDATGIEGSHTPHFRGNYLEGNNNGEFLQLSFQGEVAYVGTGSNTIRRYNAATAAFIDTMVPAGTINGVRDIRFQGGYMYVGSEYTDEVLRYDAVTGAPAGVAGAPPGVFVKAGSGVDGTHGLAFGPDANGDLIPELYVSGRNSHNVVRYDGATGLPLGAYVTSGSGGLAWPEGITFDTSGTTLFVSNAGSGSNILKYNAQTGAFLGVAASTGLQRPIDVKFGPDGLMYVASADNDRIVRFLPNGTYFDDYVPAGAGGMDNPYRVHFGPDGDVYVTNLPSKNIRRFGSQSEVVFTVSLSTPSSVPLTMQVVSSDGTAIAGSDYTPLSGTITFAPGQTSRTILVPTIDDGMVEDNQTFVVNLSNPSPGATIADIEGVATIVDNDAPPASAIKAADESHTFGTVSGTYLATQYAADGQVQTLTEETYSGNKRSRLEHTWRFDNLTGGGNLELVVVATHLNNTGKETFAFSYSTDNLTWTLLGNLGSASYFLPGSPSGTVYVRVTDTDRSNNESTQDKLEVDQLLIRPAAGSTSSAIASADSPGGSLRAPAGSASGTIFDAALLAFLADLDGWLPSGKKRN